MKTFVITISKTFPLDHPRAGELTHFKDKILEREKIHTIRSNFNLWKNRIDQINNNQAILSMREWSGTPYKSKQVELFQFTKLSYQPFILYVSGLFAINYKIISIERHPEIAANDGLTRQDFCDWFKLGKRFIADGVVIHLTDFKY